MMDLILLLQAEVDIQEAFNRYEDFQEGRGVIFMKQLDAALTMLRNQPEIGPTYASPYRRLLIRDFPYGLFYEVQSSRVVVATVMDLRQDPRTIEKRLFK
jgi:plasmid stabilization system protein ParE